MSSGKQGGKDSRFVPLKVDLAFKRMFGSENRKKYLLDFLNSFFSSRIEDLSYRTSELPKELYDEKLSRLDVLAQTSDGMWLNIEIQLRNVKAYPERSLYYASKVYVGQLAPTDDYTKLNPVICVNILDFCLDINEGRKECLSSFKLRSDDGKLLTDRLDIQFIELPKAETAKGNFNLWLGMLNSETEEEFRMRANKNTQTMEFADDYLGMLNSAEAQDLFQRQKELRDQKGAKEQAFDEGVREAFRKIVRKQIARGKSVEEIADLLDISVSEAERYASEESSRHMKLVKDEEE